MFVRSRLALPTLAAAVALTAAPALADEVTVFAAASLKTALDRIAEAWEGASGHSVRLSYAGSPQLARQIEQGAPADIFVSAAPEWMDRLEEARLVDPATRVDLLGNRLVLIAPSTEAPRVGAGAEAPGVEIGPDFDLAGRLGDGRLAMALIDSVPAGVYGKAALTALEVWDKVEPRVAQADNVRAALALVASGEAPMGIVYATDAHAEPRVSVVGTFPADSHPPIVYPAAVVAASRGKQAATDFLGMLRGETARAVFEAEGFTVLSR